MFWTVVNFFTNKIWGFISSLGTVNVAGVSLLSLFVFLFIAEIVIGFVNAVLKRGFNLSNLDNTLDRPMTKEERMKKSYDSAIADDIAWGSRNRDGSYNDPYFF